jgi:hypothetical protein
MYLSYDSKTNVDVYMTWKKLQCSLCSLTLAIRIWDQIGVMRDTRDISKLINAIRRNKHRTRIYIKWYFHLKSMYNFLRLCAWCGSSLPPLAMPMPSSTHEPGHASDMSVRLAMKKLVTWVRTHTCHSMHGCFARVNRRRWHACRGAAGLWLWFSRGGRKNREN